MKRRATSFPLALILATGACGSEEAFELQTGNSERLLETAAAAHLDAQNEAFDKITVVGDLDGDGIDDAIVRTTTAYYLPNDLLQIDGNIYILYGGQGLAEHDTLQGLPRLTGAWGFGVGTTATALGDVDGDGLADVLVAGARNMLCAGNIDGEGDELRTGAYLMYGNRTRVAGEAPIGSVSTFLRDSLPCTMVSDVASLGDLDGDGKADFAVARTGLHSGEPSEVMAFYGRGSRWPAVVDLVATADARIGWPATGSAFSPGIAGIGDVDGDGYADFVLRDAVASARDLRLVRGSATRLAGSVAPETLSQTMLLADTSCAHVGQSAAPVGDLDQDGVDDFVLVGCRGDLGRSTVVDRLFYGRTAGFPAEVTVADADAALLLSLRVAGVGSVAGGDVDGDGIPDLVVGDAALHDGNGGVHVMRGNGTRLAGEIDPSTRGLTYVGRPRHASNCDFAAADCIVPERAGYDVSIGDLTGDHRLDVFILAGGVFGDVGWRDVDGSATSRAYVLSPEGTNP
jgi:hypothetical protein